MTFYETDEGDLRVAEPGFNAAAHLGRVWVEHEDGDVVLINPGTDEGREHA